MNEPPVIVVDARGHRCPTPTLRLRRALEHAEAGSLVQLIADDPMARIDVPHLVLSLGFALVAEDHFGGELRFLVSKPLP